MRLTSFITQPKSLIRGIRAKNVIRPYRTCKMELPGVEIGVPLNIFQNVFTNTYYGYDITTEDSVALQFALGFFCYGFDRLLDFYNEPNHESSSKVRLYDTIERNQALIIVGLLISYIYSIAVFEHTEAAKPFSYILTSTCLYKPFKQNFGYLKALYIACLWTACSVILPCVLHDNNYDILQYPSVYLPPFLSIFGLSNIADLKDVEEDRIEGINTLPVILGPSCTFLISFFSVLLSNYLFTGTDYFLNRAVINVLFEMQNIAGVVIPYSFYYSNATNIET